VQTAAKLVFEPTSEADLNRKCLRLTDEAECAGRHPECMSYFVKGYYEDVVDADTCPKYFDTIPHCDCMQVRRPANHRSGCAASDQDVADGSVEERDETANVS